MSTSAGSGKLGSPPYHLFSTYGWHYDDMLCCARPYCSVCRRKLVTNEGAPHRVNEKGLCNVCGSDVYFSVADWSICYRKYLESHPEFHKTDAMFNGAPEERPLDLAHIG